MVTDLALARLSEIRIICTYFLPMRGPVRLPKLGRILSTDVELQPLVAKSRDIAALARLVDGFLPQDLARQVRVANFREGEVVLIAANSAAAAKLKLLAPSLSRFLVEQRWQVNSVSLRVQPNTPHKASAAAQKSAYFSTPTLDSLQGLYDRMTDSPAREALQALLRRHGGKRRD
jgi:hypothetical protein